MSNKAELEIDILRSPLHRPQYRDPEVKLFIGMSLTLPAVLESTLESRMASARPSTVSSAKSSAIRPGLPSLAVFYPKVYLLGTSAPVPSELTDRKSTRLNSSHR